MPSTQEPPDIAALRALHCARVADTNANRIARERQTAMTGLDTAIRDLQSSGDVQNAPGIALGLASLENFICAEDGESFKLGKYFAE